MKACAKRLRIPIGDISMSANFHWRIEQSGRDPYTSEPVGFDIDIEVEGENDDITGGGQTEAAHALTPNIPDDRRLHYTQPRVGHYGVFNGRRFREHIAPRMKAFMREQGADALSRR